MNKKEIEKLALEYDRNLSTHPMSAVELRKDLTEFALQVVKKLNIPVVSGSALDVAKQIPQVPQTQAALNDQLKILRIAANKLGLYDAADFIKRD